MLYAIYLVTRFKFTSLLWWIYVTWKMQNLRHTFRSFNQGRVVLRSDNVKDESGFQAVLTVQGASASQIATAKFLDTVSGLPGMACEANDSVSADTQVRMTYATKLLKLPAMDCLQVLDTTASNTSIRKLGPNTRFSCVSWRHVFRPLGTTVGIYSSIGDSGENEKDGNVWTSVEHIKCSFSVCRLLQKGLVEIRSRHPCSKHSQKHTLCGRSHTCIGWRVLELYTKSCASMRKQCFSFKKELQWRITNFEIAWTRSFSWQSGTRMGPDKWWWVIASRGSHWRPMVKTTWTGKCLNVWWRWKLKGPDSLQRVGLSRPTTNTTQDRSWLKKQEAQKGKTTAEVD